MKHISLFSGIGGFDLASEWMGWQNVASCEINPFGNKVLQYYWPQAYHHDDIKTLTYEKLNQELTTRFGADWRSDDIILTGGFPCQPYSAAGKRLGKEDERHLWPEMLRVIREVKPTWIVGENVLGLVNWSGGLVFEEVQADLEAEGYEVQPFVLPAASVNAPHRRDRVWFVAYNNRIICRERWKFEHRKQSRYGESNENCNTEVNGYASDIYIARCSDWPEQHRRKSTPNAKREYCSCGCCLGIEQTASDTDRIRIDQCKCRDEKQSSERRIDALGDIDTSNDDGYASDTELKGFSTSARTGKARGKKKFVGRKRGKSSAFIATSNSQWNAADTDNSRFKTFNNQKPKLGSKNTTKTFSRNGFEPIHSRNWWENFPTQSPVCTGDDGLSTKLDGITFSKWRNESIKAAGNAIVPQVVYQIFKAIEEYEQNRNHGQDREAAD